MNKDDITFQTPLNIIQTDNIIYQFIVYGSPNCGYCRKAKLLLENNSVSFKYVNVDNLEIERKEVFNNLRHLIGEYPNQIPLIFKVNTETDIDFLGGYTALNEFWNTQEKIVIDNDF